VNKLVTLLVVVAPSQGMADLAYPIQSWVIVSAAAKNTNNTTASIKVSASGKRALRPAVFVCDAIARDGTIGVPDVPCDRILPDHSGMFEIPVTVHDDVNLGKLISVAAPGYLGATVIVKSGGISIDVVMVPDLKTKGMK